MASFEIFQLKKQLHNAIDDLGFGSPTSIQEKAFPVILSGKDVLGIAQTGTGKTLAYMMPLLDEFTFSKQLNPRILILVPTRELVIQVVDQIAYFTKYMNIRVIGVYGGANINTQRALIDEGTDIVVATPGRLYDLAVNQSISLKGIKKLVIDEVDVMLDLGFRPQLMNIFELLPERRQNIMFSATMTDHVQELIEDFFVAPVKITVAVSGTPLDNIKQECYEVRNFYTKINLLKHLLKDREEFHKVLVFVSHKRSADKLFAAIEPAFRTESGIIHSNKTQNHRIKSIEDFDNGTNRILVATDVMARGLDMDKISHVINFDTPTFPENYIHRIGRTGRAQEQGKALLFYTEKEIVLKESIESLMEYTIPQIEFPSDVEISHELLPEEKPDEIIKKNHHRNNKNVEAGSGFHEKKAKNQKTNQGGSYKRKLAMKYKKAQTRGDKNINTRKK